MAKQHAAKRETRPKNPVNDDKHNGGNMGRGKTSTKAMSGVQNEFSRTGMSKHVKRMK